MIADVVTGTKIPVGIIIKCTPSRCTGYTGLTVLFILYLGVSNCMFYQSFHTIISLCRIHMSHIFRYHIGFLMGMFYLSFKVKFKIIIGKNILQKLTIPEITDS